MNTWKQTFRWKTQKVFQENIFFSCVKPGQRNFLRKTQNNTFLQIFFFRVKPSGKKKVSGEFYFQSACKMSWSWSIKWNKQKHSSTSELYFHSVFVLNKRSDASSRTLSVYASYTLHQLLSSRIYFQRRILKWNFLLKKELNGTPSSEFVKSILCESDGVVLPAALIQTAAFRVAFTYLKSVSPSKTPHHYSALYKV